jgi:probable rRNA maturation factor
MNRSSDPSSPRASAPASEASAGSGQRRVRPELQLSLQFADAQHKHLLPRHRVAGWIRAALQHPAEMAVRIVGAEEAREINAEYRQKDYATNVLTFDYQHSPVVIADLVLCAPVIAQEAAAQGIEVQAHYAHLLVHGTLHAQGLDHDAEAEAREMEAVESQILQALGFSDPYRR